MTRISAAQKNQPILRALARCEELRSSTDVSADESRRLAALTSTDLQLELDSMLELQTILRTLARKLDIPQQAEQGPHSRFSGACGSGLVQSHQD
jgi:hypothetical protein